jgi:hypothetical protein
LGPISFSLPSEAGDFRQVDAVPDFVTSTHRWSILDKGIVSVVVQSVIPLFPPDELVTKFDANGLDWQVFDTGKAAGAGTTAYAVIGGTSAVLVGGQAWSDADSNALIRDDVTAIARSVTYQGGTK